MLKLYPFVCMNTINQSEKTCDSINTIILQSPHAFFFPPTASYEIASYFSRSLVALANKHLSILWEVDVINDSITHHPVRSHSAHPHARSI